MGERRRQTTGNKGKAEHEEAAGDAGQRENRTEVGEGASQEWKMPGPRAGRKAALAPSPQLLWATEKQRGVFGPSQPRGPEYTPDNTLADSTTSAWPEQGVLEPACKERFMILFPGEVQTVSPIPGSDGNRNTTQSQPCPRPGWGGTQGRWRKRNLFHHLLEPR